MNMTPSMNCTPFARHASSIGRSSPASGPHGFSHSTCLPALAAFTTHSRRTPVGSGTYTCVHVGPLQQLVVGAGGRGGGNGHSAWFASAHSFARAGSRLATATRVAFSARRIAFQFLRAMFAAPRIPHRH
jgi:hypothetical protein